MSYSLPNMTTLGPLIGNGRQAEIYAWDDGRVVKLFYPNHSQEQVEREAMLTGVVATTGLPVPQVFDAVQIDGRHGFVMSRVEGVSLINRFAVRPWRLLSDAKLFARLHAQVTAAHAEGLPFLRNPLRANIIETELLPDEWRVVALSTLDSLPDGESVCHGDFHPDNVMITPDGPVLIDWPAVKKGAAEADVARTLVLLITATLPAHVPRSQKLMLNSGRVLFTRRYRRHYDRLTGVAEQTVRAWMLPVCAARFNENPGDDLPALHRLMARLIREA